MTAVQAKALAGVVIAICSALATFLPEWAGVFAGLGGLAGSLAPALLSRGDASPPSA